MFPVSTYEEIVQKERELNERHIIVLLFVRPSLPGAGEIIEEFSYLHYNSRRYCSIYAVGYTNDAGKEGDYRMIQQTGGVQWYYSDQVFVDFKRRLERRLKWRYSGEIEILILQSNPEGREILNFQNYVAIDVNYGIREGYIGSFSRFMETLVHSSQTQVESAQVVKDLRKQSLRPVSILEEAVGESKRVPGPLKRVLRDRIFYKTSRSYSMGGQHV